MILIAPFIIFGAEYFITLLSVMFEFLIYFFYDYYQHIKELLIFIYYFYNHSS